MGKAVKFINWTNEDFTWKWGGEPTTIKANESIWMQDWKADHFAKHLADRELSKAGLPTDHFTKAEIISKTISESGVEVANSDTLETELLNRNAQNTETSPVQQVQEEAPKKKMGRPKKEEVINPAFAE